MLREPEDRIGIRRPSPQGRFVLGGIGMLVLLALAIGIASALL